ncbi:LLM class F420-dependent oxidoreductase [Actinomadura sp. NBRC 104425]|uniref:LLM class F420-dependent oxidoreductase n=1 Tax=Actinomadura sp. NBRC 104425 TaxID=3032204 RepID=UPI0024A58378|nr:LLM class F420-dependent oxidoreductase [Actinomadura sp. NBRC 104425]GLZ14421.1 LLM class F420-dependent oxidoreductase [Actinomadura sp. NBRC 104425]
MTTFGYFLSCEEHGPAELIRQARLAEEAGFEALWISDHFHPWLDEQGHSPFVWSVIGALSQTVSLPVTTAATCPTVRMHPAIVAQAAATSQVMLDGRFRLGLGSGEALNEHITGAPWPPAAERLEMLEEAVEIIRALFGGRQITHRGRHFRVDTARLYTLPDAPPPIYLSGFGQRAASLAGRIADGFMTTKPDPDLVQAFRSAGGHGKPMQAGLKACWGQDEGQAVKTAHRLSRSDSIESEALQILPSPRHFDQIGRLVTEDMVRENVPCGPDPERHAAAIRAYVEAGFDEIYINQIGEPDGFFEFYRDQVLPRLQ